LKSKTKLISDNQHVSIFAIKLYFLKKKEFVMNIDSFIYGNCNSEVDEIMRKVTKGNVITINEIRKTPALKHKAISVVL
jgi:hypothetical protein